MPASPYAADLKQIVGRPKCGLSQGASASYGLASEFAPPDLWPDAPMETRRDIDPTASEECAILAR